MEERSWIYHKMNVCLLIFLVGLVVFLVLLSTMLVREKRDVTSLYDSVLRFHIRANSNSDADQAVKLKAKEAVLEMMKPYLSDVSSKEEAKEVIRKHFNDIVQTAKNTLKENGYSYSVKAYFSKEEFPAKKYGDLTFPAGQYEALRIDIGKAKGHNWWCMMYPSLCFVDATYGVVPDSSKEELQNLLSDEDYEELLEGEENEVSLHFKVWDKIKEMWE